MKKNLYFTLIALFLSFASFGLTPMYPTSGTLCVGAIHYVSDSSSPGGVWSSSDPTLATIGSSTGEVTGVASGVVTFTYTLGSSYVTGTFTVNPSPAAISGATSVCVGSTITLTDAVSGGVWSSFSTTTATVGSATGVVTGIHGGGDYIEYTLPTGCSVNMYVSVDAAPSGIVPFPTSVCVGSIIIMTDSAGSSGTWSSSDPAVATISSSGAVTGVSGGTAIITFTTTGTCGSGYATTSITVNPAPAAISGSSSICVGGTTTLTDATGGGTWSSSSTGVATIGATTGVATGVAAGTTTIRYTLASGCSSSLSLAVGSTPVGTIEGPTYVCVGSTITLTDSSVSGGTWSSGSTGVATITSGGVVTGLSAGYVTISYAVTGSCGTAYATRSVYVSSTTSLAPITGASSIVAGSTTTLSDATPGGTWSSSNPSVATVGSSTGVVTGVAFGAAEIIYTATGCGGSADTAFNITVTTFDGISGFVNFLSGSYYGVVKVYLITYNPSSFDLEAMDSATYGCSGTTVFYQFTGVATDSYRVKAAIMDSTTGTTTGYIPTYHTSSFYWHDADVIYHTSGTSDINKDINMASGTTTSGLGFIGGSVLTGANRGTSGAIPSVGLRMCVLNSTTSQLMTTTYTDASGNYSFSNLPVGQTYYVFPDSLNYLTTAYTGITLTAAIPSVTSASFVQHTVSHTITPDNVGVKNVQSSVSSVITFPNPTSGKLNIVWNENADEKGTVTITDITGREIYTATILMNQGSGVNQVDLSNLTNGLYLISIKTASIDYNNKIQIMQ